MSRKILAIIGSGRMAWIIGRNAHEKGIETHCFANEEPEYIRRDIDFFHNISIFDKEDIVSVCKEIGVNGVIATTELTISIAAYVAESLHLVGMPYEISKIITDKYRNRQVCKNVKDLHQPFFVEINKYEELNEYKFNYPAIVKPTSKGGKRGITVVNNDDELKVAFGFAKLFSCQDPVIIEEFISGGKEYSVEALSYRGKHYVIQVTEKISSGPPHCVELGHHQPAALSEEERQNVERAIKAGLSAIGADNTTSHTEIMIVNGKIYLIEFNCRPGGDHIAWPLTELSTGYNIIKGAIDVALDIFEGVDYSKFLKRYSGVYFVTKQTACLKPLFDKCEQYDWLYYKNQVTDELMSLEHNDCYGTNSMMYLSEKGRPDIESEIQ